MYIIFEYVQRKWVLKYFNRNNYGDLGGRKDQIF